MPSVVEIAAGRESCDGAHRIRRKSRGILRAKPGCRHGSSDSPARLKRDLQSADELRVPNRASGAFWSTQLKIAEWSRHTARAALAAVVLAAAPDAASAQTIWVFQDETGQLHFSDTRYHGGFRRLSRADSPVPSFTATASNRRWDALIRKAGDAHGVSPGLVKAVIHVESRFNPKAVSHRGARGLMQLMPLTAGDLGVADSFNPWQNIDGGTRYLQRLVQRFDGDLHLSLAAYHAGPATVERYNGVPPYRVTHRYVRRVLELYRRYDADFR
jgi:soluble lytic murein transglycosylase-like protein